MTHWKDCKDEIATTFMNQVKKLQQEVHQLQLDIVEIQRQHQQEVDELNSNWANSLTDLEHIEQDRDTILKQLTMAAGILESNLDNLRQLMAFAHSHNFVSIDGRHSINITKEFLQSTALRIQAENKEEGKTE